MVQGRADLAEDAWRRFNPVDGINANIDTARRQPTVGTDDGTESSCEFALDLARSNTYCDLGKLALSSPSSKDSLERSAGHRTVWAELALVKPAACHAVDEE
jgi:hypothetical protein